MKWRPGITSPRSGTHREGPESDGLVSIGVPTWPEGTRPTLLSLDVFDTVLTRACGSPQDLYLWLGRLLVSRGLIACSPEVFARVRHGAELDVWRREGGLDSHVGLADFYIEVCRRLQIDELHLDALVDLELSLESRVLRVVPGATSLVKRAVEDDVEIAFTSDTYHSQEYLRARLVDAGLLAHGGRCLTSAEYGLSKARGGLFERVVETVDGRAGEILHVGDHPHSDVDVPRELGLRAEWIAAARLNRYERLLSERAFDTAGLSASFAGASRMARLSRSVATREHRAIRDVAAGVAGPVLVGYVLWLLERSRQRDLSRLVFLARDGQVLARIARQLVQRLELPLEVSYLLVSRRSTNLAATFDLSDEETGWIYRDQAHLSPSEFLDRFGLCWDDVGPLLGPSEAATPPGSTDQLAEMLRPLLARRPLRDLVLERASERRRLLVDYLRQEGILDGQRTGIVDFGGVGSQIRALHAVVADVGIEPPRLFLMGLDESPRAELEGPTSGSAWLDDTETYLYDHRRGRGIRRARGFGTVVQMFCAADHGTVTGYAERGGAVVPLMAEDDGALASWGLAVMCDTIESFVDHLVLDADLLDPFADVRRVTCELVGLLWSRPTVDEAATWGGFPFEGALATAEEPRPLAYPYTVSYLRDALRTGRFPNLGWQHWYEASLVLSAPAVRGAVRTAERAYRRIDGSDDAAALRVARLMRRVSGR